MPPLGSRYADACAACLERPCFFGIRRKNPADDASWRVDDDAGTPRKFMSDDELSPANASARRPDRWPGGDAPQFESP